jgi:hypothetical protein
LDLNYSRAVEKKISRTLFFERLFQDVKNTIYLYSLNLKGLTRKFK